MHSRWPGVAMLIVHVLLGPHRFESASLPLLLICSVGKAFTQHVFTVTACTCSSGAGAARKDELKLEDLLYAVRHDPRKVARIQVSCKL